MIEKLEDGAVAVVTGAATGLGRAIAADLAARGVHVIIASDVDAGEAVHAIRSAGGSAEWAEVDVADYSSVESLAGRVRKDHGGAHILVNNAAAGTQAAGLDTANPARAKLLFEVNVLGIFNGIRAFASDLIGRAKAGQRALILNVGSEHSLGVPPHVMPLSTYTVSKYATVGFTDVARRDLGPKGVSVSLLAPGWVLTEAVQHMIDSSEELAVSIEPYLQPVELVARMAVDGLLKGDYIIATNPASIPHGVAHARDVIEALEGTPQG